MGALPTIASLGNFVVIALALVLVLFVRGRVASSDRGRFLRANWAADATGIRFGRPTTRRVLRSAERRCPTATPAWFEA